jgi:hypothetical protein
MKTKSRSVEYLANEFADLAQRLLDEGQHPHDVAEAVFLASLPILMEVTRQPTVEDLMLHIASRFGGNQVLRVVN